MKIVGQIEGRHKWGLMTNSVLYTRLLEPAEWPLLKATRLRALHDSPHAFISHYRSELSLSDHQWQARFGAATWMVASENGDEGIIGLARLLGGPDRSRPHIESVWVAPGHRRRGVLRALVHAAAELVREAGGDVLRLWVLEENEGAERAYTRVGFSPRVNDKPCASRHDRFEKQFQLRLPLAQPNGRCQPSG